MKTILILLASALLASAQPQYINVGSNADDHTGELIGHNTWLKLNYDVAYLQAEIAALQSGATLVGASNQVQTSQVLTLLATNPYVFNGSNFIGTFTNLFSLVDYAASTGTNYPLTNVMSADGGASWRAFAITNPVVFIVGTNVFTNYVVTNYLTSTNIGTNTYYISHLGTNWYAGTNYYTNAGFGGVEIAVLSPGLNTTGAVTVSTLSPYSMLNRGNAFPGQSFDFGGATIAGTFTGEFSVSNAAGQFWLFYTNGLLMRTNNAP